MQKSLGQVAYEKCFEGKGGYTGWCSRTEELHQEWEAVAQAVLAEAGKQQAPVVDFYKGVVPASEFRKQFMSEGKYPIVAVEAVDWALVSEQVDASHKFDVVHGAVVGFLVKETDDFISLSQQIFDNADVRATISIPKCTIKRRVDMGNPL